MMKTERAVTKTEGYKVMMRRRNGDVRYVKPNGARQWVENWNCGEIEPRDVGGRT
jgi:hypothetical protein